MRDLRLRIGDIVRVKGLRQRMLVTDFDEPEPKRLTCEWVDRTGRHEHLFARSALVLIKRALA